MHDAAAIDGVELLLISAFRSIEFQAALVRDKLARGITIDKILMVNAPPGYSEHHSGRAIDIGARGIAPPDEALEVTPAFAWLSAQVMHFGFSLSYPRGNELGRAACGERVGQEGEIWVVVGDLKRKRTRTRN